MQTGKDAETLTGLHINQQLPAVWVPVQMALNK